MSNNVEMMKILLDKKCDACYNGTSIIFVDIMDYSDYDTDEYIYDDYKNEDEENDDYNADDGRYISGVTALHIACAYGSIGYYSKPKLNLNRLKHTIECFRCGGTSDQPKLC